MQQVIEPWERQQGESEKAFEAFRIYRDLGSERSVRTVGQRLGKSRAIIERWSSTYNWTSRVLDYDNMLEEEARKQAIKDRVKMIERHIDLALDIQEKALQALDNLNPEEMSAKEIREYIKMATDLERLTRALDTGKTAKTDEAPATLAAFILSAYQQREQGGGFS